MICQLYEPYWSGHAVSTIVRDLNIPLRWKKLQKEITISSQSTLILPTRAINFDCLGKFYNPFSISGTIQDIYGNGISISHYSIQVVG